MKRGASRVSPDFTVIVRQLVNVEGRPQPDRAIKRVEECASSREPPLNLSISVECADKSPRVLRDTERHPSLPITII